MEPMKPKDVAKLSPERGRIAKIFKAHIDKAVEELGVGYDVRFREDLIKLLCALKLRLRQDEIH